MVLMLHHKGGALCEIDFSEPRRGIFLIYGTFSPFDSGYDAPMGGRNALGLAEICANHDGSHAA